MKGILNDFHIWLFQNGKAEKTIASYKGDVHGYLKYLHNQQLGTEVRLDRFLFKRYREHLLGLNLAFSTINKKINSLKVFQDFLMDSSQMASEVIDLQRDRVKIASGSEKEVDVLVDVEVDKLLFHIHQPSVSLRNRLIVYLLLYTGVRVSELIGIQLRDIDFLLSAVTIRGKGGKVREIALRQDVIDLIKEYMDSDRREHKHNLSPYLLLSQRSGQLHPETIREVLNDLGSKLHIKLYPHLFRHTFCTRLLRKGVDITTVSKLAGHHSVNMTSQYYIQTSKEEKKSAVEKL
jgi:integrase/recombinase XerD